MSLDKQKLINQSTPDANISDLQTTKPRLYQAIKNLGDANRGLINSIFPRWPARAFSLRFVIPGNPSVANDVLNYRHHIILPTDPLGVWTFQNINLTSAVITAKVQGAANPLSLDVKVQQQKGTTLWKSLFKVGFNPILPKAVTFTHNVQFAIDTLFQDDLLRVDVLATDGTVSGISLDLLGNYVIQEVS